MNSKLKPRQLVWVTAPSDKTSAGSDIEYVGQVMSMLTPDDTYMVRRVPGHPGTLEEMPASWLVPAEGRYTSVSYAIIGGRGSFPIDMLRYDHCAPVNFRIEHTFTGARAVLLPGMGQDLMVARACGPLHPALWTPERWSSFLWGFKFLAELPIDD